MGADVEALVAAGKLEKASVGDLKAYCKSKGIGQGGEKGTLMWRVRSSQLGTIHRRV